ncbi:hypothetical protein BH11ARM1_BH11ARM1_05730 [soil metagenome]
MRMTDDLGTKAILWKGWMFFACGCLASAALVYLAPDWRLALLLVIAVWTFCRWYFFMFYVVEKYVDPGYRFDGLIGFLRWSKRKKRL